MKKRWMAGCLGLLLLLILTGCETVTEEAAKGKDWEYTVVPERDCPEDFKKEIEPKKINKFQMTYDDGEFLYIAVGYGEQETGGFSIKIQGLYEKGESLCIETSLVGPEEDTIVKNKPSYPYIVIKTEKTEKTVEFL
ncbi:MAG: protease complex subunit PrcB family protein [Lachnospiraceae bacterium]|nr:protease complex subunit PrcB family protein [Lachnospiraceae bacterium]